MIEDPCECSNDFAANAAHDVYITVRGLEGGKVHADQQRMGKRQWSQRQRFGAMDKRAEQAGLLV